MTLKLFKRLMAAADGEGSDLSGGEAIGTGNDARVALLNSIGNQYDNDRAEELADVNDDGTTAPFVPEALPKDDEEEAAAAPADQTPPADTNLFEAMLNAKPPEPAQQMITRKVNGREVTLPLEEWLIRAQKVESADEYLQQAARLRKDPEAAPQPVQPKGPSKEELEAAQRAERRELARAIQMGTEEEAVAAIEKLQNMTRTPTMTVEEVSRVTDERLKFNAALTWFATEYKDLTADPQLYKMVVDAEAALVRNGDQRPYAERYKDVGDSVRNWKNGLIQANTPAPTPPAPVASLDDKRAAKAAAPKAPTAASTKATPVRQEEEDESPSSVIAAMAKARGGPQWARG